MVAHRRELNSSIKSLWFTNYVYNVPAALFKTQCSPSSPQLRKFDLEPDSFSGRLCEMPITFPPSYPFMEEPDPLPLPQRTSLSKTPGEQASSPTTRSSCGSSNATIATTAYSIESDAGADAGGSDDSASSVRGEYYAYTRLPGWCDRVMISNTARELIKKVMSVYLICFLLLIALLI